MKYPTMRFVFDRKKVATKTHKGLVQIEVLSEGKRKWIGTGVKVYSDQWNDRKKIINSVEMIQLNQCLYNPQIQISAESGTKRSNFRQKDKTKRSKKRLHTTLIKPEQKVNEDLCSGFIVS